MTKICGKRMDKITYGRLKIGDCFFDENDLFCIKVNNSSCLFFKEDSWQLFEDCTFSDIVYPVDVEIHIVS